MTAKNEQFCQEYMIDMNGTQAAIRCGYSSKTANVQAARLLAKANIKERIKELRLKLQEKTGLSAERVLGELELLGFANMKNYLDEGNTIKDITKLDKKLTAAVKSIKTTVTVEGKTTRTQVHLELHDKRSTLVDLGKHLGIFETDNNQKKGTIIVEIDE